MQTITTLEQALVDGIHPGELFRASRLNAREGKHGIAAELRTLGYSLANALGLRIRHRAASNDNRRGWKKRRAA